MEIKRIVDYDMPNPYVTIYDFIKLSSGNSGIVFFIDGEYRGEAKTENFDSSKIVVNWVERYSLYTGPLFRFFEESLSNWWETGKAKKISMNAPDSVTAEGINKFSQSIIKEVFKRQR